MKKILNIIIALLLLVAGLCAIGLLWYDYSAKQQQKQFADISEAFWAEEANPKIIDSVMETHTNRLANLTQLHEQNSDVVGWLYLPETVINYPVMQTPSNPEYYLKRDFNKKYATGGTPFADARCTINPASDHVIIYGHNMKDGAMFSDLLNYRSPEYLAANPLIYFYTPEAVHQYQIIAVVQTNGYADNDFDFYGFIDEQGQNTLQKYTAEIQRRSIYPIDYQVPEGNKLLSLSTCGYHEDNGRVLIIAAEVAINNP